ncbi:MAG: GWxTD domain-containing protein [Acidobacteria bacterium]|nr:GWxTD domain-containing protein [Acidobacteriota bacterium]
MIVLSSEKRLFEKLKTDAERRKFIEIFWKRRDPNPETSENEFKKEFEERVEYANLHFIERGLKGWETARGQIYILFGPPEEEKREAIAGIKRPVIFWYYQSLPPPFYNPLIFADIKGNGRYYLLRNIPEVTGLVSPANTIRKGEELIPKWYHPMITKLKEKQIKVNGLSYPFLEREITGSFSQLPFPFHYRVKIGESGDVKVIIEVNYRSLTYYQEGERLHLLLRVRCALFSQKGPFLKKEESKSLFFTREELLKKGDESIYFELSFTAPSGSYLLRLSLIDEKSGEKSAGEVRINIP